MGGETDPTWELMREAIEVTAQEYGGTVADRITDAYGQTVRCDFALVTPDFPRGVGVRVGPGGDVTFVYDHYGGYQRVASQLCERVVQNYSSLAVAKALKEMNYSVQVEETREGRAGPRAVVVRGVL